MQILVAICLAVSAGVSFAAEPYKPVFSTYWGGAAHEETRGITLDREGNLYITGRTDSPGFPTTPGAFSRTPKGTQGDIFVAKWTPEGKPVWCTLIGGAGGGPSKGFSIRVDAQGPVYVAGEASDGLPTTPDVFQPQFVGHHPSNISRPACGFIAKLKPDGSGLVWLSYCGSYYEHRDMTIDAAGDIYVTSAWDPASKQTPMPKEWFAHAFQKEPRGGKDFVVIKVKGDGSRVLWATYLGGSADEPGAGSVRVDGKGFVYVLTSTESDDAPLAPAETARKRAGKDDYYLAKLTPDGSGLVYATCLGGSGGEFLGTHSLAIDAQGAAYVSCFTPSPDFPTTAGAFQRMLRGKSDTFVSKFSPSGELVASTLLGGDGAELTEGIAVNAAGEAIVCGGTSSTDFPVTPAAFQRANRGGRDGYLAKLSGDLSTVLYATYLGGNGEDSLRDTIAGESGDLYAAGMSQSSDFPLCNAAQGEFHGVTDLVLARFAPEPAAGY
ncbi:MAG: SBBP repeat-containing protein [Candidatus Sumerlaeota bacterium]|nr:SBBP repeat-containing protein [Candidatus Sumerlaeota bacterium]